MDDLLGLEIIKAMLDKRNDRSTDTSPMNPLSCGLPVYVLRRGNDHRGATWHDEENRVIWLLAYRLHRSGAADDFFPYCTELDRNDLLVPTEDDYTRLFSDHAARFAYTIRLEAPLLLSRARESGKEEHAMLGGECGVRVAVEVVDELSEVSVAFRARDVSPASIPLLLAAFVPAQWLCALGMPGRPLDPDEVAFSLVVESEAT